MRLWAPEGRKLFLFPSAAPNTQHKAWYTGSLNVRWMDKWCQSSRLCWTTDTQFYETTVALLSPSLQYPEWREDVMGYTRQTGSERGEDRQRGWTWQQNRQALTLANWVFVGTCVCSQASVHSMVCLNRLKLLGRLGHYFRKNKVGRESMTHLSPPVPGDSTMTRKTSKLSTDPASEVIAEANWCPQ